MQHWNLNSTVIAFPFYHTVVVQDLIIHGLPTKKEQRHMGKPISLFSNYSQKENRTTNYCLLILKMLYEENPKYLSAVISSLINEDVGNAIGVKFTQQDRKKTSIPDGVITQQSIAVYIETKNFDWFYDIQLENHLQELNQEPVNIKVLIALGKFDEKNNHKFQRIRQLCQTQYSGQIYFGSIAFEEFLSGLKSILTLPKNLSDAIYDFGEYLDQEGLLPMWKTRLDVINCSTLPDDILKEHVYMCPATGGAYNHRRSRFFGMYRDKKVEKISLIQAVVDVESDNSCSLKWNNSEETDKNVIQMAIEKVNRLRAGQYPTRVFILDTLYDTEFVKDSQGGLWGSKVYFNVSGLATSNAMELAQFLSNEKWSNVPNG